MRSDFELIRLRGVTDGFIGESHPLIHPLHRVAWSSPDIASPGPALTSRRLVQPWHRVAWSSPDIASPGPALTSRRLVLPWHRVAWSSPDIASPGPALTSRRLVQPWHRVASSCPDIASPGPALKSSAQCYFLASRLTGSRSLSEAVVFTSFLTEPWIENLVPLL